MSEGGKIFEISPRTVSSGGGFAHVFRVGFEDDDGEKAYVYLAQWRHGDGPKVGDDLRWNEPEDFVAQFVMDNEGNRHIKYGVAFTDNTED